MLILVSPGLLPGPAALGCHRNQNHKSNSRFRDAAWRSRSSTIFVGSRRRRTTITTKAAGLQVQELQRDVGIMVAVVAGAYVWVQVFELLTRFNILDQKLSRKLVHMTTGPVYMLSWPFFSSCWWSRYVAALVPTANAIRLLSLGLGLRKNEGVVKSMSRAGDPRELLRGPLYYVLVLSICTVCFWRDSPVGMIALSIMCGGDGIADIIGRKFGSLKLPHNPKKSWAGSFAMFVAGFLLSWASVYYFSAMGFYKLDSQEFLVQLAVLSLTATLVESLPVTAALDDNLMVPTTVMILGSIFFPSS